jgi:hypothetical protein
MISGMIVISGSLRIRTSCECKKGKNGDGKWHLWEFGMSEEWDDSFVYIDG